MSSNVLFHPRNKRVISSGNYNVIRSFPHMNTTRQYRACSGVTNLTATKAKDQRRFLITFSSDPSVTIRLTINLFQNP